MSYLTDRFLGYIRLRIHKRQRDELGENKDRILGLHYIELTWQPACES